MKAYKLLVLLLIVPVAFSSGCVVYFTGIGCPHCAKTDPILANLSMGGKFVIIEYEIYHNPENVRVFENYSKKYGIELGIPNVLYENGNIVGDRDIIEKIKKIRPGECPLLNGYENPENISLSSLPGNPKIWVKGGVIIKEKNSAGNATIKDVMNGEKTTPTPVALSGRYVHFSHAKRYGGWVYEYSPSGHKSPGFVSIFPVIVLILVIVVVILWKR